MVLLIVHGISEKFSNMQLTEYVEISTNVTINIKSLFMWRCKKTSTGNCKSKSA